MLRLLQGHQALVGRYEQLVAERIGHERSSAEDMALIERLGRLVESQDRLLQGVAGAAGQRRN